MRWRILFVVLVMVLLSAFALAGKSEIKIEPIKNSITTTDTASFKLTISNNEDVTQRYSVFSFVQGWNIEPSPLKDKIMEIQPNQKYQTMIKASPTEKFSPGIYKLGLNIETDLVSDQPVFMTIDFCQFPFYQSTFFSVFNICVRKLT